LECLHNRKRSKWSNWIFFIMDFFRNWFRSLCGVRSRGLALRFGILANRDLVRTKVVKKTLRRGILFCIILKYFFLGAGIRLALFAYLPPRAPLDYASRRYLAETEVRWCSIGASLSEREFSIRCYHLYFVWSWLKIMSHRALIMT